MKDRAFIEIDAQALKNNYFQLLSKAHGSKIMAIVKDQFYGLGLDAILYLQELGCDFFAVSTLDEALELRSIGIDQKILILGYTDPQRFSELLENDIEQTIISDVYATEMSEFGRKHRPLLGQVKINTAMNRLGFKVETQQDLDIVAKLYQNPNLCVTGCFTHLLASDEYTQDALKMNDFQIHEYDKTLDYLHQQGITVGHTHVHNSYGLLNYGKDHIYEYCRPGLIFVGTPDDPAFQNALRLKARVAMVKDVKAGSQVGYGIENKIDHDMKIATITVGYGDGLTRAMHKTSFKYKFNNHWITPIGRMCMDQLLVDVSDIEDIHENDLVEIIGDDHDIFQLADVLETIPNELLTHFTSRLPRILI